MKESTIRAAWAQGRYVLNGWLSIPNAFSAEIMAHAGWDSVTIDLQHGLIDYHAAVAMMQGMAATGAAPVVRVPWNDPAIIMKCLDAGAYGVICPLVNSEEEAKRFVGACRYPPMGYRSMGPIRATVHAGSDYVSKANETIVRLAMIETADGLRNVDAIASVDGLDGIYIGPADLSLALGLPGQLDPKAPEALAAIEKVLAACRRAGKRCGIHTGSTTFATAMVEKGFDLVTVQSDARMLTDAAKQTVEKMRGSAPAAKSALGY
jgi:4-hydroxy-2-oxoheptanedioate aldolase